MPSPVLILSPDLLFSHVVIKILIRHDIPVVHTSSLAEALGAVDRFQALILDVDSKLFGCTDLLQAIRSVTDLPILAVSEADDSRQRGAALRAGASDAMPKAYMPEELIARVRGLLRQATERTASRPTFAQPAVPISATPASPPKAETISAFRHSIRLSDCDSGHWLPVHQQQGSASRAQ